VQVELLVALGAIGVLAGMAATTGSAAPPVPNAIAGRARTDVPSISALSPSSAVVGSSTVRLTVTGANFARTSVVRWNGADRTTTFVSPTQLQTDLIGGDLTTTGARQVTVFTQGGNGGTSNAATFTVGNPVPTIAALAPSPALLGGEPFNLIVTGSGFVQGASVRWNGAARPTTFESASRLSVNVPASDIKTGGTVQITVFNPAPLGGSSAALPLPVSLATPVIASLDPATKRIGVGGDLTLRVYGQNFVRSGSVVRWNGQSRPTTWVSPTQLDAAIPNSDVDTAGTTGITVLTTIAGATRESAAASFEVLNPQPSTTGSSPYYLRVGMPDQRVTIEGYRFLRGVTTATVNGRQGHASVESSSRLTVWVNRLDMDSLGTVRVEVTNPPPGGGTSTRNVSVINPEPFLENTTPTAAFRGGAAFTLVVRGVRFAQGAIVRWNGSDRPTTRVSTYELRASIPASDLTRIGDAKVTVVNPAPGGGESAGATVTVLEKALIIPG
jgi:hypothetical protein